MDKARFTRGATGVHPRSRGAHSSSLDAPYRKRTRDDNALDLSSSEAEEIMDDVLEDVKIAKEYREEAGQKRITAFRMREESNELRRSISADEDELKVLNAAPEPHEPRHRVQIVKKDNDIRNKKVELQALKDTIAGIEEAAEKLTKESSSILVQLGSAMRHGQAGAEESHGTGATASSVTECSHTPSARELSILKRVATVSSFARAQLQKYGCTEAHVAASMADQTAFGERAIRDKEVSCPVRTQEFPAGMAQVMISARDGQGTGSDPGQELSPAPAASTQAIIGREDGQIKTRSAPPSPEAALGRHETRAHQQQSLLLASQPALWRRRQLQDEVDEQGIHEDMFAEYLVERDSTPSARVDAASPEQEDTRSDHSHRDDAVRPRRSGRAGKGRNSTLRDYDLPQAN